MIIEWMMSKEIIRLTLVRRLLYAYFQWPWGSFYKVSFYDCFAFYFVGVSCCYVVYCINYRNKNRQLRTVLESIIKYDSHCRCFVFRRNNLLEQLPDFVFLKMFIDQVLQKISNTIEQLGKIFDQIYKIPNTQREKYFDQIIRIKDKLIGLKNNLKQSNLQTTQKQYKQIYLTFHKLKEQINEQISFNQSKENRDHFNRPNLKQTRKNHQDAMKLILEKDHKIEELNGILFQKQELIRINFDELRQYKKDCIALAQQYQNAKSSLNSLQIEYSSLKAVFIKSQQCCIDLQIKDQQRQRTVRQLLQELDKTKQLLNEANKKNAYFEELAEVSIMKCKMVQENMKIIQTEAYHLNQNYRKRESQNIMKNKQIEQMEQEIDKHQRQYVQMECRIHQLNNEVQNLQFEISKMENMTHQQRMLHYQQRNQREKEAHQYQQQLQKSQKQIENLKNKLEQFQCRVDRLIKEKEMLEKQSKQMKEQLGETKQKVDQYLLMNLNLQTAQEQQVSQLSILRKQKQQYDEQLNKSLQLSRDLQNDIQHYKQKLKVKEQEKVKVVLELQKYQREIKTYQRDTQIQERSLQALSNQGQQTRTQIINLQQRLRRKQKEIQILKARFLRAKIQIIHQIRQQID